MNTKSFAMLTAVFSLVGCSTASTDTNWSRQSTTTLQTEQDRQLCESQARVAVSNGYLTTQGNEETMEKNGNNTETLDDLVARCMKLKGYVPGDIE